MGGIPLNGTFANCFHTNPFGRAYTHPPPTHVHPQYQCMCASRLFLTTLESHRYSRRQRSRRYPQRRWNQLGKQAPLQCSLHTNAGYKIERPNRIPQKESCNAGAWGHCCQILTPSPCSWRFAYRGRGGWGLVGHMGREPPPHFGPSNLVTGEGGLCLHPGFKGRCENL